MNIKILKEISFEELEKKIREVPMMGDSSVFPYKNAHITLKRFRAEEVNPPQFYILRKGLEIQRDLYKSLSEQNYDSLNFTKDIAALEIKNLDTSEIWTLTPPIIEFTERIVNYVRQDGELDYSNRNVRLIIPLICDGLHRVAYSRERDGWFTGVSIVGADENYPYYAHPNSWDMVRFVDEVPSSKEEKRLYSRDNCYHLYRNFDILGCGKPRGVGGG